MTISAGEFKTIILDWWPYKTAWLRWQWPQRKRLAGSWLLNVHLCNTFIIDDTRCCTASFKFTSWSLRLSPYLSLPLLSHCETSVIFALIPSCNVLLHKQRLFQLYLIFINKREYEILMWGETFWVLISWRGLNIIYVYSIDLLSDNTRQLCNNRLHIKSLLSNNLYSEQPATPKSACAQT